MSKVREGCSAHYQGDNTYRCDRCGLLWDYDDPEPPECKSTREIEREKQTEILKGDRYYGCLK